VPAVHRSGFSCVCNHFSATFGASQPGCPSKSVVIYFRLAVLPPDSGLESISKLHGQQTKAGALKEVWTLYCVSRLQPQKGAQEQVCSIDHVGPGRALMLVSSAGLKRCQLDLLPLLVHNCCCCVTTPGLCSTGAQLKQYTATVHHDYACGGTSTSSHMLCWPAGGRAVGSCSRCPAGAVQPTKKQCHHMLLHHAVLPDGPWRTHVTGRMVSSDKVFQPVLRCGPTLQGSSIFWRCWHACSHMHCISVVFFQVQ
jgi:hypothetical protein